MGKQRMVLVRHETFKDKTGKDIPIRRLVKPGPKRPEMSEVKIIR